MKVPWDRGGLRTYLVLIALISCRPDHHTVLWGLPLLALGVALHLYAKGCLRQNQVVVTGGPYRFVRHPFYTANLLIDVSLALMSGWWPLMVTLPVWWFLVYLPVMGAEERHLTSLFPDTYPAYQQRLPRLFPIRRALPSEGEGFSWHNPNIVRDTVLSRLLRLLAYPLLFLLCQEGKAAYTGGSSADSHLALVLVAALLTLYGLAWEFKRHMKGRARILPAAVATLGARLLVVVTLVTVAATVCRAELEAEPGLPLVGAAGLLLSLGLYLTRPTWRLIAEGLGMAAVMALCELPWLAAAPILWYAALFLDQVLGPEPVAARTLRLEGGVYALVMVGGLLAAMMKAVVVG